MIFEKFETAVVLLGQFNNFKNALRCWYQLQKHRQFHQYTLKVFVDARHNNEEFGVSYYRTLLYYALDLYVTVYTDEIKHSTMEH